MVIYRKYHRPVGRTLRELDTTEISNQEKIIEAAEIIIAEKGIKDTSLSDISKQVGISKGTLYYYYKTKNDLIYDIADRHLTRITEQLEKWIDETKDKDIPENIIALAYKKITSEFTRGRLHLYLIKEAVTDNDALKQKFILKYDEWHKMIEKELVKLFGTEGNDKIILANIILASLDGFTIQSLLGIENNAFLDIANLLVRGLKHET